MKLRIWSTIISGVLLVSLAQAQTFSHFDLSGDVSFNGATLPTTPSSSQVRGFGGQTSGVTHLNRWFGITSQFGLSYLSADSISLIGYTGPGTMQHYSMLVGPRITFMTRSRVNPFVEGLAGADRASTSLTSSGTKVTGTETQTAYAVGGGAQINLSRHFGLNFEGEYFGTQHTTAFTGWQPANFQVAAGIVIRMFGGRPQIAEGPRVSAPSIDASVEPAPSPSVTSTTDSIPPVTSSPVDVQTVIATPATQSPAISASEKQMPSTPASMGLPAPVVIPPAEQSFASTTVAPPQIAIPAAQVSSPVRRSSAPKPALVPPAAQSYATASVAPSTAQTAIPAPQVSVPVRQPSAPPVPVVVAPAAQSLATASVTPSVSQPSIPAPRVSVPTRQASAPAPPAATQRAQTVAAIPATTASYAPQSVARSTQPPVAAYPSTPPQTYAQPQAQAPPISLGEYARRLREKKEQERKQQQ